MVRWCRPEFFQSLDCTGEKAPRADSQACIFSRFSKFFRRFYQFGISLITTELVLQLPPHLAIYSWLGVKLIPAQNMARILVAVHLLKIKVIAGLADSFRVGPRTRHDSSQVLKTESTS